MSSLYLEASAVLTWLLKAFPDLRLLSFDRRLLENARALGID